MSFLGYKTEPEPYRPYRFGVGMDGSVLAFDTRTAEGRAGVMSVLDRLAGPRRPVRPFPNGQHYQTASVFFIGERRGHGWGFRYEDRDMAYRVLGHDCATVYQTGRLTGWAVVA